MSEQIKEITPGQFDIPSQTPEDPFIWSFTGKRVHLLTPREEEIDIRDIAHGLAFQCRFTGQCLRYVSVAEHSILVSEKVPRKDALWGLLHDASEAYLHDMSRPLKHNSGLGTTYRELENKWMAAITRVFGLPREQPESVSEIDNAMLHVEMDENMAEGTNKRGRSLYYFNQQEAEAEFLHRFAMYTEPERVWNETINGRCC